MHKLDAPCDAQVASPLCLAADAFDENDMRVPPSLCVVPGVLRNANTMEDFKEWDKPALLAATAKQIWEDITSGVALVEPERLMRFIVLTFADLKYATAASVHSERLFSI